jgi:hypothetical protein
MQLFLGVLGALVAVVVVVKVMDDDEPPAPTFTPTSTPAPTAPVPAADPGAEAVRGGFAAATSLIDNIFRERNNRDTLAFRREQDERDRALERELANSRQSATR